MTIIYFLLLLSVIITIHEAGHLLAAKKFNVYCYEFSFGMGPLLWHKKTKETQYSIRAIPIGGYVSMAGEADGDEMYPDIEVEDSRRLINKPWWQKIIIMLAGVFMNFLLAWVIFSLIILSAGAFADHRQGRCWKGSWRALRLKRPVSRREMDSKRSPRQTAVPSPRRPTLTCRHSLPAMMEKRSIRLKETAS